MSLRRIQNPDTFRANIRKKLNEKFNDEQASTNLEKGIFNYALKEAEQRKIIKKWDNTFFVQIYLSHLKSILNNLSEKWIDEVKNGDEIEAVVVNIDTKKNRVRLSVRRLEQQLEREATNQKKENQRKC